MRLGGVHFSEHPQVPRKGSLVNFRRVIATIAVTLSAALSSTHATASSIVTVQNRIDSAKILADQRGTTTEIAYLDRTTGRFSGADARHAVQTASVVKLFIADNLLYRESKGEFVLSAADRQEMSIMLQSSDDTAAQDFWTRFGGSPMVTDVIHRYQLGDASAEDRWFDTLVSPADMVRYYDQLLRGNGGLPSAGRDFILNNIRQYTTHGTDGYDQCFGVPHAVDGCARTGTPGHIVQGVKQGWMQSEDGRYIHNSTDVLGPSGTVISVIFTQSPLGDSDDYDRESINEIAASVFPSDLTPGSDK